MRRVIVTERLRRQYRQRFEAFLESIQTYCRGYGLSCTRSTTEVPFDQLILRMMRSAGVTQ
ncbi:hypothetical protein [Candidatus Laterigemmans baculatus]|uniref:hypothetical protein n=1 Tax=Candidatus Laterigemmans baculatus TaxID=2770505 RepID=UPI001F446E22|nr:hypothetical protein [Candidatus Laterigemmans baculatus]